MQCDSCSKGTHKRASHPHGKEPPLNDCLDPLVNLTRDYLPRNFPRIARPYSHSSVIPVYVSMQWRVVFRISVKQMKLHSLFGLNLLFLFMIVSKRCIFCCTWTPPCYTSRSKNANHIITIWGHVASHYHFGAISRRTKAIFSSDNDSSPGVYTQFYDSVMKPL